VRGSTPRLGSSNIEVGEPSQQVVFDLIRFHWEAIRGLAAVGMPHRV
jgi:hypothetical protein